MKISSHPHSLGYRIGFWVSIFVGALVVALLVDHLYDMKGICGVSHFDAFMYGVIFLLVASMFLAGWAVRKILQNQIIFNRELESRNRKMRELAITDGLTKVYNHRFFENKLKSEWLRMQRFHHSLACVMLDIDNFKPINDNFGHRGGDAVLRRVAGLLRENLREVDIISRYGGEEFTIILLEEPNTVRGLKKIMEKLRRGIEKEKFDFEGHKIKITASLGGALAPDPKIDSPEKLVHFADKAMYHAKTHGKNASYVFGEEECC
ncbi:MAG: GGDEF domain-containing protein [Patescibacteria group bacterium]